MPASKIKLFLLIPIAAALLVFGSTLSSSLSSSTVKAEDNKATAWTPLAKKTAPDSFIPTIAQIGTTLTGILILAVGCVMVMRRFQSKAVAGLGNEIRIKESCRLSSKRALHMICAGDRLLLLAETEHGIGLISDLTPKDDEEYDPASLAQSKTIETETGAVPRDLVIPQTPQTPQTPKVGSKPKRSIRSFKDLMSRMGT